MNKSFTLIEILVVIVVIGVLSAFILVGMSSISSKANIARSQAFDNSLRNSLLISLISEWKFDNITDYVALTKVIGSTAGNIPDSWKTNNCTASGGPILKEGTDCVSGECISFDGSGDFVDCGDISDFDIVNQKTISFWIKPMVFGSLKGVISKMIYSSATDRQGYYIRFNASGYLGFSTQNNAASNGNVSSSFPFSLSRWYYVVEMFDFGTMKIYIDGIQNNQTTGQTYPATAVNTFKIASTYGPGEAFNGLMDEVRIYNSALSQSQIEQNYITGANSLLMKGLISKQEYTQRITNLSQN